MIRSSVSVTSLCLVGVQKSCLSRDPPNCRCSTTYTDQHGSRRHRTIFSSGMFVVLSWPASKATRLVDERLPCSRNRRTRVSWKHGIWTTLRTIRGALTSMHTAAARDPFGLRLLLACSPAVRLPIVKKPLHTHSIDCAHSCC